ncbi:MAG: hypothetical protein ACE5H4_07160 [Candidatus Thorarchaeota archaeon]
MTTISIKEDTRRKLLQIAGDIQKRTQERVDFDTVIRFLIDVYTEKQIDLRAWKRFTAPIAGVDFDSVYHDLILERRADDRQGR